MDLSTSITRSHLGTPVTFQRVDFADKLILNIYVDGVIDTTFDVPVSTRQLISGRALEPEALDIEPVVLVGDPQNLKIQIVASQIAKVVLLLEWPRNMVLSIGSRWFGRESQEGDFERMMFVLEAVKELLQ